MHVELAPGADNTLRFYLVNGGLTGLQCDLVGDTHFNRFDNTHQGVAELSYVLSRVAAVTLGYQRTQRDSTSEIRAFHADLFSIGVRYTF